MPVTFSLDTDGIRIVVAHVLGTKREGEKLLLGFAQLNGLTVKMELDQAALDTLIPTLIKARSEFGTPDPLGVTKGPTMPVSFMSFGRMFGSGNLFLEPHFAGGGWLGLDVPSEIEAKLKEFLDR